MNTRAVILWEKNTPSKEIKNKIAILKRNGLQSFYLVSNGETPAIIENESGIIRLHNSSDIGGANALVRAIDYIQTSNIKEQYGFFLFYGSAVIDDRILSRMHQIVTISDYQSIDMFMVVRLTDKAYSKKYSIGFDGCVTHSTIAIRGNESLGIFFLCNNVMFDILHSKADKISDLLDSLCKQHKKIFVVKNGCC